MQGERNPFPLLKRFYSSTSASISQRTLLSTYTHTHTYTQPSIYTYVHDVFLSESIALRTWYLGGCRQNSSHGFNTLRCPFRVVGAGQVVVRVGGAAVLRGVRIVAGRAAQTMYRRCCWWWWWQWQWHQFLVICFLVAQRNRNGGGSEGDTFRE